MLIARVCTFVGLISVDSLVVERLHHDNIDDQSTYDPTEYLNPQVEVTRLKIQKSSTELSEPLDGPLFFDTIYDDNNPVDNAVPEANATGGTLVLAYHKTGIVFSLGLIDLMEARTSMYQTENNVVWSKGQSVTDFWQRQVRVKKDQWAQIVHPHPKMPLPTNVRTIHFYRNPVSSIVSGYRYHLGNRSAEKWETRNNTCFHCDEWANTRLFALCNQNCSYYQLLSSVPEDMGVLLEGIALRRQLNLMVFNMKRWTNDRNVLHVTMEHLRKDFDKTVACMMRFLGLPPERYAEKLRGLNVAGRSNRHVTSDKYENEELHNFVRNRDAWQEEFTAIRRHENMLWARQSRKYGCPSPK